MPVFSWSKDLLFIHSSAAAARKGSCAWPREVLERLSWGWLIVRRSLSEASHGGVRLHGVSRTVNSGSPWAVKGRCLSVCSWVLPSFPFRELTLLWEQIDGSFKVSAPMFLWAQSLQLRLLCMKGVCEGLVPFHALLPSFIWDETHLRAAYTLVPRICLQC